MNKIYFIPTAVTGEVPAACFGEEFGGRDDFSMRDWQFSGAGLEAPGFIAAGSHTNNNHDEIAVSRYTNRGQS